MSDIFVPPATCLILATHNQHKVSELRQILTPLVPGFNEEMVIGAADLNLPEILEDGLTFTANALIKARAVCQATGIAAVADDSGICVDALGGAPGIFSARWCGRHGDDQANLELLLAQLSDLPDQHRQASFLCAAAVVTPDGRERSTIGEMKGTLLRAPQGEGGFGYDPIFQPEGYQCSSAQLTPAEKNSISHRGDAFKQLAPVLATIVELASRG